MSRVAMSRVAIVLMLGVWSPAVVTAQTSADTSFAIPRNAVVDITMSTGRITVRGGDRGTAELRSDGLPYELRATGVGMTLVARDDRSRGNRRRGGDGGTLDLTVPRGVRLRISAGSGDVDVRDIAGDVEVHALSGDVALQAIGGRLVAETMSGDLSLTDGADNARVTTMSGDITLRGVRGMADVHTTSGSVTLSMVRAAQVQVESTSGDIGFEGDLTEDARIQLVTHSGDVRLRLPDAARAALEVSTFSGELSSNRPLTLTGGSPRRRGDGDHAPQHFELGGGGPARLSITTFNGDVHIERGGKRSPD